MAAVTWNDCTTTTWDDDISENSASWYIINDGDKLIVELTNGDRMEFKKSYIENGTYDKLLQALKDEA